MGVLTESQKSRFMDLLWSVQNRLLKRLGIPSRDS